MNLLTLSKDGIPLLNGEPIEGLVAFKLSQDSVDDIPVFEAKDVYKRQTGDWSGVRDISR